jgi:hypothetical protein
MQFGGFLGIGSDLYPLPWDSLKYEPRYVVSITKAAGKRPSLRGSCPNTPTITAAVFMTTCPLSNPGTQPHMR